MLYNNLSLKREEVLLMKKITRLIPLLFAPLVLTSCSTLSDTIKNLLPGNHTSSSSSSSNSSHGGQSSHGGNSSSGGQSSQGGNSSNGQSSQGGSSSSSSGGVDTPPTPKPTDGEWTIMVYMCGADLESDYSDGGYASKDIEEIRKTLNQPDNVNIIFETGGASSWKNNIIGGSGTKKVTAGELGRYHIENNNFVKDGKVDNANMGDKDTLKSFLNWGFETYPANKYGLILWNHGGAMDGVCFDENYGRDGLTADEIDYAVTNARSKNGISDKLEFLTYDACIMAIQDLAEVNSHNFKYMLSSQESEVGDGYDYDAWLPTLYSNPTTVSTKTILTKIADTFIEENKNRATDQTQSVFDLSKMSAYKTAFDNFSSGLAGIINTQAKWDYFASIVTSTSDVQTYAEGEVDIYNLADSPKDIERSGKGKGLLTALKNDSTYSSLSTQIADLEAAVSNVVAYEIHQTGTYGCGMCIAVPAAGCIEQDTYQQQTPFTTWYNLCAQYGNWYSGGWWW